MSTDTVQHPLRRIARMAVTPGTPGRNPELGCIVKSPGAPGRNPELGCIVKSPGTPGRNPELGCIVKSPGTRKPSAVERLEADKAKYVKSQQVALKKQQPVTCPSSTGQSVQGSQQPLKKVPVKTKSESPPLDLEHLCKLIDGVSYSTGSVFSIKPNSCRKAQETAEPRQAISPMPSLLEEPSGSASCGKAAVEPSGTNGGPSMTVRRVDVKPQLPQRMIASRDPLQNRLPGTSQVPIQLLRLLRPYTRPNQQPIDFKKPHNATVIARGPVKAPNFSAPISPSLKSPTSPVPIKPITEPLSPTFPTPITPISATSFLAKNDLQSPPSPAITRHSSTSSRKRPSLTRSKSDVSDCISRAGAELERFFNYCGLDPSDLKELSRPGSDIVSVSRLRSASAPTSERTAEGEDEEEEAKDERLGYGISVIERNARVIKWLYGMRQAKESPKVAHV